MSSSLKISVKTAAKIIKVYSCNTNFYMMLNKNSSIPIVGIEKFNQESGGRVISDCYCNCIQSILKAELTFFSQRISIPLI